jgi:CheY-like chemotaxis protein
MKTRVLLVDDDLHVRAFMDEALHFLGYEVVVADGAAAALACLAKAGFDVVVTDHRMPEMEGIDFVRAARGLGFDGRVYVVSGVLSARERLAYDGLQVDGIATKPLSLSELNLLLRTRSTPRPEPRWEEGAGAFGGERPTDGRA